MDDIQVTNTCLGKVHLHNVVMRLGLLKTEPEGPSFKQVRLISPVNRNKIQSRFITDHLQLHNGSDNKSSTIFFTQMQLKEATVSLFQHLAGNITFQIHWLEINTTSLQTERQVTNLLHIFTITNIVSAKITQERKTVDCDIQKNLFCH